MTTRMWDILVRKLVWAQDHGDRAACLLIAARLRQCIAEGGPR